MKIIAEQSCKLASIGVLQSSISMHIKKIKPKVWHRKLAASITPCTHYFQIPEVWHQVSPLGLYARTTPKNKDHAQIHLPFILRKIVIQIAEEIFDRAIRDL